MKFIDLNYKQFKTTDIARCLKARYTAAPTNHTCEDSGVLIGGGNMEIKIVGNKNPSGHGQGGVIYDVEGILGALGVANSTAPNVAIRAVLTPDREEKHQNGRRMKDDGEPMFTLTAQDRHGVAIAYDEQNNTLRTDGTDKALKVIDVYNKRELKGGIVGTLTASGNTSIGHCGTFLVAEHNDADIYTGGTVGTLTTDGSSPKHNNRVIVGEGCNDGNAKERNTFEILCLLRKEIGEKAFAEWGIAIVAPFQQAEVLRQGVHEKSFSENREEQSDIQQRPYNSEIDKQVDYKRNCLPKMWDNAEFRCSPCGRGLYQQFREQFDCALQKLSHENPSPQEFMYSLWQASEGIRVLREALSEIQEIRGRIDMQRKKSVRIRRLTPREVWRLQGFPDEYFDRAKAAGVSDSQLYKQAGNAVTVNVARAIGERLKEIEDEET